MEKLDSFKHWNNILYYNYQGEGQEDATDGDIRIDGDEQDGITPPRLKVKYPKYVDELDQIRQKKFLSAMTSELHIWLVIIVGLFFAVPAVQIAYRDAVRCKLGKI